MHTHTNTNDTKASIHRMKNITHAACLLYAAHIQKLLLLLPLRTHVALTNVRMCVFVCVVHCYFIIAESKNNV